jgi:hypothetical protein
MSTADDDIRDDDGTQTVDLARYRAKRMRDRLSLIVDRLLRAIDQRDPERVWALLDDPEAYRCIPSNVREEALTMAQLPRTSLRAPVRLYRYQYLLVGSATNRSTNHSTCRSTGRSSRSTSRRSRSTSRRHRSP